MVMNGPKEINKDEIIESALEYAKLNKLNSEEIDELLFIVDSFRKFYNKLSNDKRSYSPKTIFEKFEKTVLTQITGRWTGLHTNADVFYKKIPLINKILSDDTIEMRIKKAMEKPSHSSYGSYGGCGGRSSYGGC